ncbi:MAG TPA: transposase [Pseudonocardiaceae bacterium]|nr:transposase [Pseudonocardiaceae bacterium]
MLAESGDDPDRYTDAKSCEDYVGISPITRASGKKKTVMARSVRNDRLIDALMTQAFSGHSRVAGQTTTWDGTPWADRLMRL